MAQRLAHVHEAGLPQPHVSHGEKGVTQPARCKRQEARKQPVSRADPKPRCCRSMPLLPLAPSQDKAVPLWVPPGAHHPARLPGAASPGPAPTGGICQDGVSTRSAETCSAEAQARGGAMQLVYIPGSRPEAWLLPEELTVHLSPWPARGASTDLLGDPQTVGEQV